MYMLRLFAVRFLHKARLRRKAIQDGKYSGERAAAVKEYFCGWYFKCQSERESIALIPAVHCVGGREECSVQLISSGESLNIPLYGEPWEIHRDKPWVRFGKMSFRPGGSVWICRRLPPRCREGSALAAPRPFGTILWARFARCRLWSAGTEYSAWATRWTARCG